ncbi:MAG: hypothetical protein CO093_00250 [Alphaproteobacteria bacterium CG_4_9_14_3_um_filter_47_13]|nr:MAG: hypothetical protein CO093_00250 [Alphaproteobacteria bacterium CG_4_9_14_3_um_filter_47_13]
MSKGKSGRIVIEVDPALKRKLYSVLAIESSTLKDWFIQTAEDYIKENSTTQKSAKASSRTKNEL